MYFQTGPDTIWILIAEEQVADKATDEQVADKAAEEQVADKATEEQVDDKAPEKQVADKAAEQPCNEDNNVKKAEEAPENFQCYLCDFKSNWGNGLNIHMTRKHDAIEQLDGNATDIEDQKYAGSKHYWEEGRLGSVYQTFLDAKEIIEESELDRDDKENEKTKLLEARKTAFGKLFHHFPPWSLMT